MNLQKDHQLAIGKVFGRGYEIFGSQEKFNTWLTSPTRSLDNQSPLSRLNSKEGVESVLRILTRLERGVYS